MTKRSVQYFGEFLRLRLEDMAKAANNVYKVMAAAANEFEQRVRNRARDLTEEERNEFYVEIADEHMFFSISEQFARRAMLVTACAHFEDSLKRLCKLMVKLGLSKKEVPAGGFYIKESRCFLSKITGADGAFRAAAFGNPWLEIYDGWRHLRNSLMHDNGVVDSDRGVSVPTDDGLDPQPAARSGKMRVPAKRAADAAEMKRFIEGCSDVMIESGELVLGEGAVDSFLKTAAEATDDIIRELVRIAPPSPPEPPPDPG